MLQLDRLNFIQHVQSSTIYTVYKKLWCLLCLHSCDKHPTSLCTYMQCLFHNIAVIPYLMRYEKLESLSHAKSLIVVSHGGMGNGNQTQKSSRLQQHFMLMKPSTNLMISRGDICCRQERFEHTDAHLLGQSRTIGWISDLAIFHRLVSLSLSDNDLGRFPVSVCAISTLQELDLSCNRIKILPQEVQHMTK